MIVIRAPEKIYQDGKKVGTVVGQITRRGNTVIFEMLTETADLKENLPFEYQKERLRIMSVEMRVGKNFYATTSESGKLITQEYHDVLQKVVCESLP